MIFKYRIYERNKKLDSNEKEIIFHCGEKVLKLGKHHDKNFNIEVFIDYNIRLKILLKL
jgi:hypothetical protein